MPGLGPRHLQADGELGGEREVIAEQGERPGQAEEAGGHRGDQQYPGPAREDPGADDRDPQAEQPAADWSRNRPRRMIEDYVRRPRPGLDQRASLGALTAREVEVLTLIAQGRANAEIGAALFLSEPTIKTYVTRILAKLQLRDRVQAVVFAHESGLVQPGGQ